MRHGNPGAPLALVDPESLSDEEREELRVAYQRLVDDVTADLEAVNSALLDVLANDAPLG